jgi:hypothetical protein
MPVEHQRGKMTKWQHALSFTDIERKIIEKHQETYELSFNGAIRDIIRRFENMSTNTLPTSLYTISVIEVRVFFQPKHLYER